MKHKFWRIVAAACMVTTIYGCGKDADSSKDSNKEPNNVQESVVDESDESSPDEVDPDKNGNDNNPAITRDTKFSDTILVSYDGYGQGMGTEIDCMDALVTIYKNHEVIVTMCTTDNPEVVSFTLTDEEYNSIEALVDPYEIATLYVQGDQAVCDGTCYYLTVYDEADNPISKGAYMPTTKKFWDIRDGITDILEPYGIRDYVFEYKNILENGPQTVIEREGYEYYCKDCDFTKNTAAISKLSELSKEPNNITDVEDWFDRYRISPIDEYYIGDEQYTYYLDTTAKYDYPSKIIVYDEYFDIVANIDMSNYAFPDECIPGDEWFVEEEITHVQSVDNILYVSISHHTYAESAPHNAYIIAIDMNDMSVVWQSQPLVANASNFVIYGDTIFTGYGFTKEDDYIYALNRYNGEVCDKYKVKSGPDYLAILEEDGLLAVRCYDTDYLFNIE